MPNISGTAAGSELNKGLMEQARQHRQELRQLEEEMEEKMWAKKAEARKELEVETQKLRAEIAGVKEQSQQLASEYGEEKAWLERRLERVAEAARIEGKGLKEKGPAQNMTKRRGRVEGERAEWERARAEYKAQVQSLQQRLTNVSGLENIMQQMSARP
ncbi:hypothetical protein BD779DRAFT_1466200 [Infundibulicybe gibba]|nr:hypothetical protein BD779DRAFT_1466200 [Infundibulicybe gibba]